MVVVFSIVGGGGGGGGCGGVLFCYCAVLWAFRAPRRLAEAFKGGRLGRNNIPAGYAPFFSWKRV